MLNSSIFVERLKEYMEEEKLNETALAKKINFDRVTVSGIINEAHTPSTPFIIAVADYFNCSVDYLLGRKEYPTVTEFKHAEPIGERLRKCMKEAGKTEYRLQKDLEVSSSLTYRWLNNKALPKINTLITLSKYFGCSIDYLLGRE